MKELGYFVYQIYPKSFKDSTASGVGDINGIRSKLSYIADLGFDFIWLTPMYISPQNDNGYDVENYYQIDPSFGTEAEFDLLVKEAEKLGLKIMMDMVFNHTSTEHEWFKKALAGEKKYQDYYIFSDYKTTWESKFGGNAWEYVEDLDKYYLHLFDKTQADLNWENENVRQEIYQIVNFWINRGVKGFRFDVINLISKRYPLVDGTQDGRNQYTDGPRVHEFLQELRKNTFAKEQGILTVGEMSSTSIEQCAQYANNQRTELDSVFHFHHLKVDYQDMEKWSVDYFDFPMLKTLLRDWQLAMQEKAVVDTLFWSCHDQPRIASRFIKADTKAKQLRKNKSLAIMMYLMRGISYIYQGEEIGMENIEFKTIEDAVDIEAINYYNFHPELSSEDKLKALSQKSRDNARAPMQWSANGGFSDTIPWIKVNENTVEINVEKQLQDQSSTYNFYRDLINFKKNNSTFISGEIAFIDDEKLFIYRRFDDKDEYQVIVNLWNECFEVEIDHYEVVINNGVEVKNNKLKLKSFSAIVIHNLKS